MRRASAEVILALAPPRDRLMREIEPLPNLSKVTEALRRQAELLDLAHDAILVREQGGAIRFWNKGAERLYGWPRGQALGRRSPELLQTRFPNGFQTVLDALARAGSWEGELSQTRRDGSSVTVLSRWSERRTENGSLEILEINQDITERKNMERAEVKFRQLIEANATERNEFERALREKNTALEKANAAKDLFLSSMSHELHTPLNAVIGFAGTLLMRLAGPLNEEQERQLRRIQAGGKHLLSLVDDLLDLAKIESGKVELQLRETSCQEVLGEVVSVLRPVAEAKSLNFETQFPDRPLTIKTDRRALSQILLHLGNNAIKFTPQGSVRVEVSEWAANGQSGAAVRVVDTGVGIKAEDQSKLFQGFERINPEARAVGAGIGLYLCRKLAGLIGGRIELESEYGKGSRFTLLIPQG